ncbi:acid protease [Metschnikowia bicuspidata var. bicuspidata NRRL YB-4993]|uniref:Acid protease n=1 Tax=Metschnikowia bicuspidata var. bicuspidata NRRL YB-4993 TaxID=869754 RepID=A0A1A0H8P7_9ASCO|nr:acid protease [Metschnikowia bicuspidata var. bicuspidata NRRL YB-4993]OBA20258.1 acid protease [Metschnikowia bicuspidata var. bicuspidata NRRL YB-4993]
MVSILHHPFFCLAALLLVGSVQAASSSVFLQSSASVSANATTTSSSLGPAMITVPVMSGDFLAYNIIVTDNVGQEISVLLDYMQPHVWFVNAEEILNCSAIYPIYQSFNFTNCYNDGAYTPLTTVSVPTTLSLNITYPYGYYGSGYFMNSNFSLDTVDAEGSGNGSVALDGLLYLLADDTNLFQGGFGLAGPVQGGGVLDTLKSDGRILCSSFSAFYYNRSVADVCGYVLLGAVDQNLYVGDLYVFPQIPHEGWGDDNAILPILQLDSIELENPDTQQVADLYEDGPVAVVLDPTLIYSYLPRAVIISLALQTNAYFTAEYDTWLVNCSAVDDIDASVNFEFGPLSVQVPLSSIVQPSLYTNLTFSDGLDACVFNIAPADLLGYNAFGTSFLLNIYMAMDNEGGLIAVANANTDFTPQALALGHAAQNSSTAAYIESDYIPFATNATVSSDLTLTFGTQNFSAMYSDPGLLTNVVISSGHVYLSQKPSHTSSAADSASAADAKSMSGGAGSLNERARTSSLVLYGVLLLGGIMGLVFM